MNDYPPLESAQKALNIQWYRTKIDRSVLREMTRKSDARGLTQALGHLILYLATGSLVFWLWFSKIWWGFAVALFLHGTVTSFFHGTANHELSHNTVFKTKRLNTLFLKLFSFLGWWNYVDYAISHKYHHIYTLYLSADRENVLPLKPLPGFFGLIQLCTVNLFGRSGRTFGSGGFFATLGRYTVMAFGGRWQSSAPSIRWLNDLYDYKPDEEKESRRWIRITLLFHALIVVGSLISGLWVLPIIILLGPFIANITSYSVGITQHSGMMVNHPDFRKVARSVKLGPVLSFLYWRMNWHCEHHMYAAVPCYNLPKFAKHIAFDLPKPKGLMGTWREMLEIWKHQKNDPSYEFQRVLPDTATPWSP